MPGGLGAGFRSAAPGSGESRGAALPGTTSRRRRHRPTRGAGPAGLPGACSPRRRAAPPPLAPRNYVSQQPPRRRPAPPAAAGGVPGRMNKRRPRWRRGGSSGCDSGESLLGTDRPPPVRPGRAGLRRAVRERAGAARPPLPSRNPFGFGCERTLAGDTRPWAAATAARSRPVALRCAVSTRETAPRPAACALLRHLRWLLLCHPNRAAGGLGPQVDKGHSRP
ncbi:uncharacterized protein FYW23_007864 isoform 1-T3 [Sylvia borin]